MNSFLQFLYIDIMTNLIQKFFYGELIAVVSLLFGKLGPLHNINRVQQTKLSQSP